MTAVAPPTRSRSGRGRAAALLIVLAGATALAAVPTWFSTSGTTALEGAVPIDVTGSQVAPAILAAAVAVLAAGAAVGLVGRVGRWVVALVVVACGALVVGTTLGVTADPADVVSPVVAARTGVGTLADPVTTTAWPWVAAAVGVLDAAAGGWLVRASRGWSGPSRRHEAAPGGTAPAVADERSDWDALSRGDDPS